VTLLLTHSEIVGLLTMPEVIDLVETAHRDLALGRSDQPVPATVTPPGFTSLFVPMVAASAEVVCVKVLSDVPDNPGRALPAQQSVVVVVNPETGVVDALLPGAAITLLRTAAASAVATRHLARAGSRVLGLIGAGAQAHTHLDALRQVRDVDQVLVWSRSRTSAERFAERHAGPDLRVQVCDNPQVVVRSADIVCTLTPSLTPIVKGAWFHPGLHINAVGAPPRPTHREVDGEGMHRARVVVDSLPVALDTSGEVLLALAEGAICLEHVGTELGQVIVGSATGREHDSDVTLFDSVGVAIQDASVAAHIVKLARARGAGTVVDLAA